MRVLHLTTHLNTGGITHYLYSLLKEMSPRLNYVCIISAGGECEERFSNIDVDTTTYDISTKSIISPKLIVAFFSILLFSSLSLSILSIAAENDFGCLNSAKRPFSSCSISSA